MFRASTAYFAIFSLFHLRVFMVPFLAISPVSIGEGINVVREFTVPADHGLVGGTPLLALSLV